MENNHPNILDNRESVTLDDFLQELDWESVDLADNWFDPTEADIPRKYTLSWRGVRFAPIGGIHGLTGQPGHGKTFTFTQLMVALLAGEYQGIRCELDDPNTSVLYIDTEMERANTQLVIRRVYNMMGWPQRTPQDRFRVLWLREEIKAEDRWRKVLKAIWEMKPTAVFLDGLIDVIGDFNNNIECQKIIYQCMAVASHYGISMWCLLHLNPGSDKMVGHVGSFLERKATDVLKTKKDKDAGFVRFTVTQNKARARDLDDWSFRIEDDEQHYGHPVIEAVELPEQQDKSYEMSECKRIVDFIGAETVSYTRLREGIKKNENVGSSKANDIILKSVSYGILDQLENNKFRIHVDKHEQRTIYDGLDEDGLDENKAPF